MKLTITSEAMEKLKPGLRPGAGLFLYYDTEDCG